MEVETPAAAGMAAGDDLRRLLTTTLRTDKETVEAAAAGLDRVAADPRFTLAVAAGQVAKEPVPQQLEQIAAEILVPLQVTFRHLTDKMPQIINTAIRIPKQSINLSVLLVARFIIFGSV